jgi:hypothetical protein
VTRFSRNTTKAWAIFLTLVLITVALYRAGLNGAFLFDDFPNIVDNPGVKPNDASIESLARVALSSPSSEFKRPLASLSFGANYLVTGSDPYWMKVTNLVIHVLNGWLVFLLARRILRSVLSSPLTIDPERSDISAALIAGAWLLLPINLTAVLYVVQRMESLANLFVLAGLLGYLQAREAMRGYGDRRWFVAAVGALIVAAGLGAMAKETAVMLPLYAFVAELVLFTNRPTEAPGVSTFRHTRALRILFLVILWLPMILGLVWLLPGLLRPSGWSTREFTMSTRLLTEARVVVDYLGWTIIPRPDALSFYHDDFVISQEWLSPWSTLASASVLAGMVFVAWSARRRLPTVTLGIGFFIACHLLTATILPLELVYEHRNYFASFGVLLAIVPLAAQPALFTNAGGPGISLKLIGPVALGCLFVIWAIITGVTSSAWSSPLSLARELAARAPGSPRAQYELGRTYIILSGYDPSSPFTQLAYAPLEAAAALPHSGVLAEQALIFMNARIDRPVEDAWWESMNRKLRESKVTVQDESALASLVSCVESKLCDLPTGRLAQAFYAALSHGTPSARLLGNYGNFAWNQLADHSLGTRMLESAVSKQPNEAAYRITLARMYIAQDRIPDAMKQKAYLVARNASGVYSQDVSAIDSALKAAGITSHADNKE